ncbi:MAG: methyltransferase family protein [Xanthobacteraceae bacterium]
MRYSLYDLPLAVLWLAWLAYWLIAARNVKTTRHRESSANRFLTIALTTPAAALLAVRGPWIHWLSARFLPQTMVLYWLGLLMVICGLAFAVWARIHLGRNWSGTVTVKEDHELIRSGPYGIVRHPIYTGLLLAIAGTAIVFGEWRGLLAFGLLTIALSLKLRREERFMQESFPEDYVRYQAQVPALVPWLGGSHPIGGTSL